MAQRPVASSSSTSPASGPSSRMRPTSTICDRSMRTYASSMTVTSSSSAPRSGAASPAGVTSCAMSRTSRWLTRRAASAGRVVLARGGDRLLVARVHVAHDARAGIGRQHSLQPLGRIVGAVGDDDHPCMDRVADAHASPVMDAHPRRTRGGVEKGVEDGPVGDRVGAVAHRLGLAVRRGYGACIEMVSSDDDGRTHAAGPHELVDRKPGASPVAVAEPADPGREPLERHPSGSQLEPPLEHRIVREGRPHRVVDRGDVRLVSGQRRPAERPYATTEQRPYIGRDKARVCEGILYAGFTGLTSRLLP